MEIRTVPSFVKDANYLRAAAPSLIFVGVEWCKYCQQAKPIIEEVARTLGTTVPVYYVNADVNTHLSKSLGVQSYPTIFFVSNTGIFKFNGERSLNNLVGFVCEHSGGSAAHSFCTARKNR